MSIDHPGPPDSYPGYDWQEAEAEDYTEFVEKLRHFDEARMTTYLQLHNIMEGRGGETKIAAQQQLEAMTRQTARAFSALGDVTLQDTHGNIDMTIRMLTTIYSTDEQERVKMAQELNPDSACLRLEDYSIERSLRRCFMTVLDEHDPELHTPEDTAYDLEHFYAASVEEDFEKCPSIAPWNVNELRHSNALARRDHLQSAVRAIGKAAAGGLISFIIARKLIK